MRYLLTECVGIVKTEELNDEPDHLQILPGNEKECML